MDNQVGVPNTDHRPVPEIDDIVLTIDQFHVCIIKFNRLGTLIAAGGSNGSIALLDFTTKTTSNVWNAHALGITNITWTRDGSKLFSSGLDNVLVMSDVLNGVVLKRMHIGTFILTAALNPRLNSQFFIHTQFGVKIGHLDSANPIKICEKEAFSTLSFDHRGKYILAGTSKGQIKAFTLEGKCLASSTLDSYQPIRNIYPTRRFNLVIVVASDMFIRVYELNELLKWKRDEVADTINTLYEPTSKTLWHSACASGDSDYIAALASTAHEVTIFERATEAIVATLCQSKKEIPLGLEWHPAKPAVASVCNGNIFIWKQRPRPCWAAYAPDFTELGENLVYREKESEFDVDDEDFPKDDGLGKNQTEELIDVETVTAPPGLCSSDEDDPNKIWGSVFFVSATPAVIPLKTTLPSQLRPKEGALPSSFLVSELHSNHFEPKKIHKKKKRKKTAENHHQHQNGIHNNNNGSILSPSPNDTQILHPPTLLTERLAPPQSTSMKDSPQTTSRKSSDAIESPPRLMRHRLKRKRPSKPSKSSSSPSPIKFQSYSSSPVEQTSPIYSPFSPTPSQTQQLHLSPVTPESVSLSSSTATPTHENWNVKNGDFNEHIPHMSRIRVPQSPHMSPQMSPIRIPQTPEMSPQMSPIRTPQMSPQMSPIRIPQTPQMSPQTSPMRIPHMSPVSSPQTPQLSPIRVPQMPPLLPPPPPPKQSQPQPTSSSPIIIPQQPQHRPSHPLASHPGLQNISSDEEEEEPPSKRQKRSSSTSSSSSSSAVNHAWDSD
uniref:Anaphase-promoting complex subunit 4 WD40 domain-containing protein n=1 Tax=Panagrolaimus superbus TaxID=310955 RepID=A0A914YHA6_9BILA